MFNFGAFAGGLATAIQTQQKLNLEEDKYNADIKTAEAKLKLEGEKLQSEISKKENDRKVKDANIAKEVENVMASDKIDIDAKVKSANNIYRAGGYPMAKAIIIDPTSGEKFVSDVSQELLPTVEGIQKDLDIYKNEGNFKLDNTGALYTRPNAESEFTPIGFKGTNAKAFTKEDKVKNSFGVINGKEGFYTEEQLTNATAQGMSVERSKDKPATTSVKVMGEDKPIEIADEYGTFFAKKDTGEPILNKEGKKVYSKLGDKTSKVIEGLDTSKRTVSALDNMVKILDKNPEAVGSFGENPYEFVSNYANDFIGIPTKELVNRNTIDGMGGVIAAMIRNTTENGVMTKDDIARYQKLIPKSGESEIVFRNKVKTLTADMNNTIKRQESRYSKELPNFVKDDNESAIAPYEETQKSDKKKSLYEIFKEEK